MILKIILSQIKYIGQVPPKVILPYFIYDLKKIKKFILKYKKELTI